MALQGQSAVDGELHGSTSQGGPQEGAVLLSWL